MCRVYRHFSRGFVHKNNIAELTTNFNRKSERKSHDLSRNCRQMICCHPFFSFLWFKHTFISFFSQCCKVPDIGQSDIWMCQCQKIMCAVSVTDRYSYEWHHRPGHIWVICLNIHISAQSQQPVSSLWGPAVTLASYLLTDIVYVMTQPSCCHYIPHR